MFYIYDKSSFFYLFFIMLSIIKATRWGWKLQMYIYCGPCAQNWLSNNFIMSIYWTLKLKSQDADFSNNINHVIAL